MDSLHETSDHQSLALTRAAIERLIEQPALADSVLDTLAHWDTVAPPESKPLRDEWRRIVRQRDWARALARDDIGQQLRQASPLGKVLPRSVRWSIIRQCKGPSSNT